MKSRNRKSKGTHPSVPQPRTPQPQYSAAEVLICSRPEGLDSNEALLRNIGALPVSLASALARFAQEMGYGNPIALMVRIELPIVEGITPQPIKRAAARPESHPSQPTLLEDDGDDQDEDDDDPDEDNQDDNDEREKSLSEHEQRRVLEIAGY